MFCSRLIDKFKAVKCKITAVVINNEMSQANTAFDERSFANAQVPFRDGLANEPTARFEPDIVLNPTFEGFCRTLKKLENFTPKKP